jgi:hypothetical protein
MTSIEIPSKPTGHALFQNVPEDYLQFGQGNAFDAKRVTTLLGLKKVDVSHITQVAESSVRYDNAIPTAVKERLEDIASTINLVAKEFQGDPDKTVAWFKAQNPLLGDISPRDMIRLGKYDRLRRFIINAMMSKPLQTKLV